MSSGTHDRLEYIKQPHILALLFVVIIALGIGIVTGWQRLGDLKRVASLGTFDACMEYVKDEPLCRFAEADEKASQSNYVITSTATTSETTEISTLEIESADRMKSVTFQGPKETEAFVVIDAVSYVKDYADGVWAMYEDPEFEASEPVANAYDFSSPQATSTVEFRDSYKSTGTEPCGELTCHKYRITASDDQAIDTYIWFDDTDFLIRRHLAITDESTTNNQFSYQPVTIAAPSPTKAVSEEEMSAFLEQE